VRVCGWPKPAERGNGSPWIHFAKKNCDHGAQEIKTDNREIEIVNVEKGAEISQSPKESAFPRAK
jgi:hypothetical protein